MWTRLYSTLLLCLTLLSAGIFVIYGTTQVYRASASELLYMVLVILCVEILGLGSYWGTLKVILSRALLVAAGIVVSLSLAHHLFREEFLFYLARMVAAGLITVVVFLPLVFDNSLRLVSLYYTRLLKNSCDTAEPGAGVAFVLFRNRLLSTMRELLLGVRVAHQKKHAVFGDKVQAAFLVAVTLAGRIPVFASDLLTATYVSKFELRNTKHLNPQSPRVVLAFIAGTALISWIGQ